MATLKYGDLILLQGSLQSPQLSKKDTKVSGFLSAIGYTENRVFLQTVPKETPNVTAQLETASNWDNYRELIFEVWPKVNLESHKQMKKFKKKRALWSEGEAAFEKKMKKLIIRVEAEIEGNKKKVSQFLGRPVLYGAEIHLMHFHSKAFLSSRPSYSDSNESASQVELINELNSGMTFKFLPKFQIRQEGDAVQLKDQIFLYSMKTGCYVNVDDKPIEFDEKLNIPKNLPVITSPLWDRQMPNGSQRHVSFLSQASEYIWKLHLHEKHIEVSDAVVRGGDLIRLKHVEINAYLAADVAIAAKNPEVFGQKYSKDCEFKEEYNNINTVWEVEREGFENRGKICSVTEDLGKPETLRLRHLLTRKLLNIETVSGEKLGLEGGRTRFIGVVSNYDPESQKRSPPHVIFRPFVSMESQDLTYNVAYGVGVSDGDGEFKYLKVSEPGDSNVRKQVNNPVKQPSFDGIEVYTPLNEDELPAKVFMLCENTTPEAEHAFMLTKVTTEEEAKINFVASSIYTLKYFSDLLKSSKTDAINNNAIAKTLHILKDLIIFVQKIDDNKEKEEIDTINYVGATIQENQRLLKDFKVIDLLMEILYYPFYLKLVTWQSIRNEGLYKVFQHCFTLIKHMINGYTPNKIYASQWLKCYFYQAFQCYDKNYIKVDGILNELSEKKILNDKITTEMISNLVTMLKSEKNGKFVHILSYLCVCDGEPVVKNQIDTSKYIIEDKATRDHLIYQSYRWNNDQIEVRIKEYEINSEVWMTLPEFKRMSEEIDEGTTYRYFTSMVSLLADLCLGRNYIPIDFLQTVYTYDICYQVIQDVNFDFEIRAAFAKLMLRLWIDRKPYKPLNIPQYLISWDEISPIACKQIAYADIDHSQFHNLKNFLKTYFQQLASKMCNKIYKTQRNKFTFIVLEITTRLLNFGFYTDIAELKDLTRHLLVILNGMRDAMTPHEYKEFKKEPKSRKKVEFDNDMRGLARHEQNENTRVVMDCKNQICEIIKIILNIDYDFRLRLFLLEFKNKLNSTGDDVSELNKSPETKPLFKNWAENRCIEDDTNDLLNIIKDTAKRNAISLEALAPTNFIHILFDLCLYQHEGLVRNSLYLLYNFCCQRTKLEEMLEKVHIIQDSDKKTSVLGVEEDIRVLRELTETIEAWYDIKDIQGTDAAKKCIQLVKKLGAYLTDGSPLLQMQISEKDNVHNALDPFKEDDGFRENYRVDSDFQAILRALKAHQPLLKVLEYESKCDADITSQARMILIGEICDLLIKFAYSNETNQALLMDRMPIFLIILTRYPSSRVDELIEVLFKNNRTWVRQLDQVRKVVNSFFKTISHLGFSNRKSAKMMMSLLTLMKYKGNLIKANQTTILALLTQQVNNEIFVTSHKESDRIFKKLEDFNNAVKNSEGTVELPPELDYLNSQFEIMACACDGKNTAAENESQYAWSIENIALLYNKAEECWILKRNILAFVYHTYWDTKKPLKEKWEPIVEALIKDIESIQLNSLSSCEIRYHKGTIDNNQTHQAFFFNAALPCISVIIEKKLYLELPSYDDRLTRALLGLFHTKSTQKSLSKVQTQALKSAISCFHTYTPEIYTHTQKAMPDNLKTFEVLSDVTKRISMEEPKIMIAKEDVTQDRKLKMGLSILKENREFLELIKDEFISISSTLNKVEETEHDILSSIVDRDQVIQVLIKLGLQQKEKKKLKVTVIKILGHMFENVWDEEEIILIQNELCRLGIVNAVCEIIVQNDDVELQNECLDLGVRVLNGGNAKVQEAFCDYIQSDAQNSFMLTIKNLIEKSLNLTKEMSLNYEAHFDGLDEKEAESAGNNIKLNVNLYEGSFISKEFEGENESSIHAQKALELLGSVYRLLQLFCEGHNLKMQNLLREQTDKKGNVKGKSQDFISITPYYFNTLVKQINPDSVDTATQILCFLMESMQGPCEQNQLALAKANIIHFCLDFWTNFKEECDYKKRGFTNCDEINHMIIMAVRVLDTLIEGSHNPEIIEAIGTLDFEALLSRLAIEYKTFVEDGLHLNVNTVSPSEVTLKLTNNHFFRYLFESFYLYIFIANLTELHPKFVENPENYSTLEQDALKFFKLNVGDVEIMFNGKLLKVYFPKYPACRYLSPDIRENLMTNVNRETPHDKIKSFVKATPGLLEEIRTEYALQNLPFALSKRRYNFLRDFSTFLSLLINIIILCVSYYKIENNTSLKMTEDIGGLSSEQAINILGYIQLITSSLMLLFWIIMNVPIILRKKWRQCTETHKARSPKNHILAGIDENTPASELPLSVAVDLLLRDGYLRDINNGHLYVKLLYCWKSLYFIISDERFLFSVFYLVVSILGLAVSEISYCLHLLDIINRFDALKTIVRSVTHNLYQLLLTSMLGVILIYIYSLVGFYFIDEMYYNPDVGTIGERSCTSMFHCYITTLNYGLRSGGGIGEVLTFQSYESSNRIPYFFRLVFDFSFFVIINVIFLNIILGIIVDAFAELRDKKREIEADMRDYCFICNIDRYTFDKNANGFKNHIKKHHYLWNYLFFIHSIYTKDKTEYNSIESYISDKLEAEDISWFPLYKAIELEGVQEEKSN